MKQPTHAFYIQSPSSPMILRISVKHSPYPWAGNISLVTTGSRSCNPVRNSSVLTAGRSQARSARPHGGSNEMSQLLKHQRSTDQIQEAWQSIPERVIPAQSVLLQSDAAAGRMPSSWRRNWRRNKGGDTYDKITSVSGRSRTDSSKLASASVLHESVRLAEPEPERPLAFQYSRRLDDYSVAQGLHTSSCNY